MMNERTIESNLVTLSGEVVSGFQYSHEAFGEQFYTVELQVRRLSDACDIIPLLISDRLVDVTKDYIGTFVTVTGQYRSYNRWEDGKSKLLLSTFVRDFNVVDAVEENKNCIELDGFICKEPIYRKTPLGREVADIIVAVNRPYGKSDYIPCICWGRNARYASRMQVGDKIKVEGRIQSRMYQKRFSNTHMETRTAYEISVGKIITEK